MMDHDAQVTNETGNSQSVLLGRHVVFVGKLGGLNKREAIQLVRDSGGTPVEQASPEVDLVIVGADSPPLQAPESFMQTGLRARVEAGEIEVISESEFWQKLGIVEAQQHVKKLYTPAMLAELLKISVRTIRRWHRMGLIQPARVAHRLPYFDFTEVQTARQLANWIDQGAKPSEVKKQLQSFASWLPSGERSLAQLDIILEGSNLLLRKGEGLVEAGGQMRIDFDAFEPRLRMHDEESHLTTINLSDRLFQDDENQESIDANLSQNRMLARAAELEDQGYLQEAIEWYRVILAKYGPQADMHFQLAELLYREGEVEAARERYYAAIEVDDTFIEARANLGCVLQETGRPDLAIAAFRGALVLHEEYADVHYHLARVLDETQHPGEALVHWQRFIDLAPESPWAMEAHDRLNELR